MKKPLLSFLLLCAGITGLIAQPSLTQAFAYVPGDVVTSVSIDTVGVQPGNGGANQTWNFAGIQLGTTSSSTCLAPSATPYASSFPTATVAFLAGSNNKHQYWKVNSTSAILLGQQETSQAQIYQDPQTLITYPFTYNSNITDNVTCNYMANGFMVYRSGTSQTVADGYGTLVMPGGTFTNVLRVHLTYQYKDSVDYGGGFSNVGYTDVNEYHFFNAANKTALLSINYVSIGVPGSMYGAKLVAALATAVGVDELSNGINFNLYPNPTINNSTINFELESGATVKYELMTYTGQQVKQVNFGELPAGSQTQTIDVSGLSSGIYFLTLDVDGKISQRKLIIE